MAAISNARKKGAYKRFNWARYGLKDSVSTVKSLMVVLKEQEVLDIGNHTLAVKILWWLDSFLILLKLMIEYWCRFVLLPRIEVLQEIQLFERWCLEKLKNWDFLLHCTACQCSAGDSCLQLLPDISVASLWYIILYNNARKSLRYHYN